MSRDSSINGVLFTGDQLTSEQIAVFAGIIDSNELRAISCVDDTSAQIQISFDNMLWGGFRPRGYNASEHSRSRFEPGMSMNFDEFLAHLISQPEFEEVEFMGAFCVVTDGEPFPTLRRITVTGGQVIVSTGRVVFGDGEQVAAPEVASL